MTAVNVFQFPIPPDTRDDQRGILLSNVFVSKKSIRGNYDIDQRHARRKLGINHALQGGSQ